MTDLEKNKKKININCISVITSHQNKVNLISEFPSTNIVSISDDKSIIIYNNQFNILQKINNAHDNVIFDLSIKDENNFATCSSDKSIKTWIKINEKNKIKYKLNKTINNAHNNDIHKIIFFKDETIISCSKDSYIKIFLKINSNYQCQTILSHQYPVYAILFIEKKNLLIASGSYSTTLWNFDEFYIFQREIFSYCLGKNALKQIDGDKIICGGRGKIQIISLNKKKIIKEIDCQIIIWAVCVIHDKKLVICGGVSNDLIVFDYEKYEIINQIKNAHLDYIRGVSLLSNGNVVTNSEDFSIIKWEIIEY